MDEESQRILLTIDKSKLKKDDNWGEVVKQIGNLSYEWKNIGCHLHLKPDKMKEIEDNNPKDNQSCLREVILEWLKGNYNTEKFGEPSWRRLAEVVVKLDKDLFKEIADAHKTDAVPVHEQRKRKRIETEQGSSSAKRRKTQDIEQYNGEWTGYYKQAGLKHETACSLTFGNDDSIGGQGRDEVGKYTVSGKIESSDSFAFTKEYERHSVTYSGSIKWEDNVPVLQGKWKIGRQHCDDFRLTPK